jgi:hypothetical protein
MTMAVQPLIITTAQGTEIEVQPTLQDTLAFEQFLRQNRKWGGIQDNALKLHPFKAFNAARRLGTLPEGVETWEQFTSGDTAVLDVSIKRDPDDDDADDDLPEGVVEVPGLGEAGQPDQSTD